MSSSRGPSEDLSSSSPLSSTKNSGLTDTGQAVPTTDRLPRCLFDPDFLKERAYHRLGFFGVP